MSKLDALYEECRRPVIGSQVVCADPQTVMALIEVYRAAKNVDGCGCGIGELDDACKKVEGL